MVHYMLLACSMVFLLISIFAPYFLRRETYEVRHSILFPIIADIAFIIGGCINLLCALQGTSVLAVILSGAFIFAGVFLLLAFCFWKISYTETTFQVNYLFAPSKIYNMSEVNGITDGHNAVVLHLKGKHKIRIDAHARNIGDFVNSIELHYRYVLQKGFALPDIPPKLFGGHIQNPGNFIALFVAIGLFILSGLIISVVLFYESAELPADICKLDFKTYEICVDDNTLEIQTSEYKKPFVSIYFNKVLNSRGQMEQEFLSTVSTQKFLTIWVDAEKLHEDQNGKNRLIRIYQLEGENGTILLRHDEIAIGYQWSIRLIFWLLITVLLLFVSFVVFFCFIVSNAPQFPRLVRILVKESWLNV